MPPAAAVTVDEPAPAPLDGPSPDRAARSRSLDEAARLEPVPAEPPVPETAAVDVSSSYYGPGLYGHGTACGQVLTTSLLGVAHRQLPCGTPVTLRYGSSTITVPVVDRGPYVLSREFDLTYAAKVALGCPDLCRLSWLR